MNNSRYNGSPAFSPISRASKRLENTSMTNLLTPTKSNKSLLSSTRIASRQSTPRYSLSKPMDLMSGQRSPLTTSQVQFNSNSTFYSPSKVTKSPVNENSIRDTTYTHQAKYSRPGLFPVVHFFQKKVPVITAKQNSCVIKLSSNGPGLFDDTLENSYEPQSVINTSQAAEPSTRSVLDALKEISRKRIHGGTGYDKEKDKSNEYSKRNREEDTSLSPKSTTTSPQQAPKRICVVDPIYASNTSSFCLKNNKRKLYECWLPTANDTNKKVTVETQTQTPTAAEVETKKSVAVQNEDLPNEVTKKPVETTNNDSRANNKKTTIEEEDNEGETIASVQRAWDEKIYAIQKKNKLAIVLSRITGEEPKLIPVPRIWDKTNDVIDSPTSNNTEVSTATSVGISNGLDLIPATTKTNESLPAPSTGSTFAFGKPTTTTAPTIITTACATTPIVSSALTSNISTGIPTPVAFTPKQSTGFALGGSVTDKPVVTSESSMSISSSGTGSTQSLNTASASSSEITTSSEATSSALSVTSNSSNKVSTSEAPNTMLVNDSDKNVVNVPKSLSPGGNTSSSGGGFKFGALGGNYSSASPITTSAPIAFSSFGGTSSTLTPSTGISSPFALKPTNTGTTTIASVSTGAPTSFASPTLKTSAFSASKPTSGGKTPTPIFGSPANGVIPSLGINIPVSVPTTTNAPIVFGATSTPPNFGGGNVSFATAFGLKEPTSGAPPSPNAFNSKPATSGFPFKTTGPTSAAPMFNATPTTTSTGGFGGALFGTTTAEKTSVSNTTTFGGGTFGTSTTASTGFGATTAPTSKPFAFGGAATTTTAAASTFGGATGVAAFGSGTKTASPSFGAPTTSAVTPTPAFGGFGGTTAFGATGTNASTQPSGFGSTAGSTLSTKPVFGSAGSTTTPTGNNTSGGFAFGGAAGNPPPPSYAAATASNVTTASGFGGTTNTSAFTFGPSNGTAGATTGTGSTSSGFGASSFGSSANPTTGNGFGAAGSSGSGFGVAATTSAPGVFGFGGSNTTTKPATGFGATTTGAFGFGGTPTPTAAPPAFGQAPATAGPVFNFGPTPPATTTSFAFGSTTPAATTPAFGSSGTSATFGSTAAGNTFGASAPTPQASGGFGSSAPNVNPFGKSTASAFGAPATAASSAFGAPSNPGTAFGGNTSATPAFGAAPSTNSTFGSGFGSSNQTNFNSSFGTAGPSASASANSTFNFGGNATNNTSGFGSTSNNTSAFGGGAPSGSFNFKSPTADTSKPVFAFGGPEQPKPASSGFNFNAGPSSPAPNTSFGAAFGQTAPQQQQQQPGMFNIGSGAPVKRVQLRAKRRT